ncbi:hypothetical protein SAMN05443575_1192 [Jatrophihabitans endophyticus]|uniref:PH domain-containing protein n=1 Tax=Jatrophihabitans endophyticus TaxID=1206085 RepID=A0A1M5GIS5_9ACTN|nr:hypothetical protein [Jatrophihabitans endophyticus]SHG03634.1 hypothetical protein SAMN05443575_1192 [Jatrophihabitans endophyticus]
MSAPQGAAIRLDTGRQRRRVGVGLAVLLALAGGLLAGAFVANSTGKRVFASVLVVVLVALAALVAAGGRVALAPHRLLVDPAGLAWDARRRPWRVDWDELVTVELHAGWRRTGVGNGTLWTVRLRLVPRDPDPFAGRHPELAALRGRLRVGPDAFAVPLGPTPELVEPVHQALRSFGGSSYGGMVTVPGLRAP